MNASSRPRSRPSKILLARSPIHGRGIFARRAMPRGAIVLALEGSVVSASKVTPYGYQLWRDTYLEPRGASRSINHACDANATIDARLRVRLLRRVEAGEEITIDYSSVVLWEPWTMHCDCQHAACRKVVRAWPFAPAALRRRVPRPLFAWVESGRVPPRLPARVAGQARARAKAVRDESRRRASDRL